MTEGVPFSLLPIMFLLSFLLLIRFLLFLLMICFLVPSPSSTSLAHPAYLSCFPCVSALLFLIIMFLPSPTLHAPSIFLAITVPSSLPPVSVHPFRLPNLRLPTCRCLPPLPSPRPPPLLPVRIAIPSHRVVRRRYAPTFPASAGSAAAGGTTAAGLSWRAVFALVALFTARELLAGGSMVIVATLVVVERRFTLATAQGTRARGIVREPWCVRATRCLTG